MYCSTVLLYNVQLHLHYLMLQQYYMNSMLFHVIIYATDCNKHCSYSSAESKSLTACDLQADIKIYSTAALCIIFMILVSLENAKKYSHVVARLPQKVHLSREKETKIVKITHSAAVF